MHCTVSHVPLVIMKTPWLGQACCLFEAVVQLSSYACMLITHELSRSTDQLPQFVLHVQPWASGIATAFNLDLYWIQTPVV